MTTAVAFDGVTFAFPDGTHDVLEDATFEVPEGAFVLVTGTTGSGKSTLLRACNGLVPHFSGGTFSGAVVTAGLDTLRHAPRELAGAAAFVPQDPGSAFVLDQVEDELAYAMENLGITPPVMRRRVEEVLDLLDLAALRDRSVRSLSGGERQRVAIAGALTAQPRVLLLDEPTSQLDPQGAEDVLAALQRLVHDLGLTVLVAEHRLERVAGFVDAALGCLGGGRVVYGEPRRVMREAGTGPPVARLGELLGWEPRPLTVRDARRFARDVDLPAAPRPAAAPSRPAG
ncbi:MAG: energy-coupling factor ABC transporter ATP-binding protein, partial [Actinomycetota bacterium]|nr:energy-coupling factor ABC transporter ATP-binding protein [Actinomycetota bacterium]